MKKTRKTKPNPLKSRKIRRAARASGRQVARATSATVVGKPPKRKKLRGEALKYRAKLLALRDHLLDAINSTASESLKLSPRESSGDISGYPTHMADAGAEDFDREFALSLISSEQEGLYEIEEALKRLENNTFGICEMCEKPIKKARLQAVPFARFCIQCQTQVEKERKTIPLRPAISLEETAEEEEAEESNAE